MHNRRNHDRRRAFEAGRLAGPGTGGGVDCILRDLSPGGARLLVAAAQGLPADATLAVGPGQAPRPVRVVWRGEGAVGVRFTDRDPAEPAGGGTVVSLTLARAARQAPADAERLAPRASACAERLVHAASVDAERLAERVSAVTRPRSRPLPPWAVSS